MKKPTTRGFLRGVLLLSLSAGRVGCFIVCGAGRPRSTAHQLRPPSSSCCVDRPLQTHQPQSREAGDTTMVLGGERRLVERARSERANCLRQVRCLLACLLLCSLHAGPNCYMTMPFPCVCHGIRLAMAFRPKSARGVLGEEASRRVLSAEFAGKA